MQLLMKFWAPLESIPKLHQELHGFRGMSRIDARLRKARDLWSRFSQSLASLRERLGQRMVHSTIQHLGRTAKPLILPERLTISILRHFVWRGTEMTMREEEPSAEQG
jgi:hypothetical protein